MLDRAHADSPDVRAPSSARDDARMHADTACGR